MIENFIDKLKNSGIVTLETTPSREPTIDTIIDRVKKVSSKIDGFTTTDSPLAKMKFSSILASLRLQSELKKPSITTMTMRDKNKIALQSDLLGMNSFDLRLVLALTGDPARMSDQPHTKGVFEGNSFLLLDIIRSFNNNMDYSGKNFKVQPNRIYPFAVTDSNAKNFSNIEKKISKKLSNGAIGIISQPIFDIENGKILLNAFGENRNSAILGFFPITKLKTAQFLSSHVPGVYVPREWVEKLEKASKIGIEEEYKVGLDLSINIFKKLYNLNRRVHIMTANNFEIVDNIIGEL